MDGKLATPDALIAKLAERQHGVLSIAQLRGLGVSEDAVRSRVLIGRLHRLHRGVYAVGHQALSCEGRCMAAVLAVGRGAARGRSVLEHWGAAVSHRSAAVLWGLLPGAEGSIDVIVAGTGGIAGRRGIRAHRSRSLVAPHLTLRRGIPITTPVRTVADLRATLGRPHSGRISSRELRQAVRQAAVLGLSIGDDPDSDGTRSDLERAFLRLCRRHRLPRPEVNVRIGPFLVDFLWCDRRLIVETDGYRFHRGREAFRDDRRRDLELIARGYEVIRLSEEQIDGEPARVVETLTARLRG